MISCIYVRDIYKKQVKTALVLLRRFLLYKWFCSSQAIHAPLVGGVIAAVFHRAWFSVKED